MAPLLYSLQFRGFATAVAGDVIEVRATAPGGALVTTLGDDGLTGGFRADETDEALLQARLVVVGGTFDVTGRITVGYGNVLHYRALGRGRLACSPDPQLRQGAIGCEVVAGEGQFAAASGTITSSLLLSDSGDFTDTHLGVVFLGADASRMAAAIRSDGNHEWCGRARPQTRRRR
jgi:hypothetical protein